MKAMPKIRPQWLRRRGACKEQVVLYRKTFGSAPVEVTLARLRKAARVGLDLDWFAEEILKSQVFSEYHEATTPEWRNYGRKVEEAWAKYLNVPAATLQEYGAELAAGFSEYRLAAATALWAAMKTQMMEGK